jgi:predicted nucleic acid-binding protein
MKIFLDTAPLLLLLEGDDPSRKKVREQIRNWLRSDSQLGTSVITLSELLEHPKRLGDVTLQYRYRALLGEILAFPFFAIDDQVAELAADFMARHQVRLVVAQQMAVAVLHQFDVLYTSEPVPDDFKALTFLPA